MGEDSKENEKKLAEGSDEKKRRLESKVLGILEGPGESPPADADSSADSAQDTEVNKEKTPPDGKPPAGKDKKDEAPSGEEKKPEESLDELLSHKDEIEALLSSIEDSYRDATLPDKTYHEVKDKNEKKLDEINKKIEKIQKTATPNQLEKIKKSKEKQEESTPPESTPETASATKPSSTPTTKPPVSKTVTSSKPVAGVGGRPVPQGRADAMAKFLEDKIEEKLKDVITEASVEVTDKRLNKIESRIDPVETAMKNVQAAADTATKTVGNYDKKFTLMNTEIEKVKALVDSVKEARKVMDEKLQRTTESFAEIRSIVYQREARSKEQEVAIDKMKDTLSQVDTARILREFTTRDEQLRDVNTRIERLERSGKMLSDSMNRIKGLMTDIGSLENIVKASKHVGEKLEKIQEIEERMKATSSKLDSVYVDMKKKIDEFNAYKIRQDKLSGMADDLTKSTTELSRRLADYATKTDITTIKDELKIVREMAKKAATAPAQAAVSPEIAALKEEKEEITTLMDTLQENYASKQLGEAEYKKAKDSNIQKIKEIDKKIAAASSVSKEASGAAEGEGGHTRVMLLAKLRESYENGEISKKSYDESRKLLLRKK